jgi:hypothetical protein
MEPGRITSHHVQQQEKTQWPPMQKEVEEMVQFIVQGRETFLVTRQMIRFDQETTQKTLEEVEQVEMVMDTYPPRPYMSYMLVSCRRYSPGPAQMQKT